MYFMFENLVLEDVPGDGHCLMYAVQTSLKRNNSYDISIQEMSERLSQEVKNYSMFYSKFVVDRQNLETEIQRYISHKEYSNNTGDLVLSALNSALELKTTLIQTDGNEVRRHEIGPGRSNVTPSKQFVLAFHGEHYQAIVSRQDIHSLHKEGDHDNDENILNENDEGVQGQINKEVETVKHAVTSTTIQSKINKGEDQAKVEIESVFAPELVRPFPKAGERKQTKHRKRKQKSAILTDTPEKAIFEFEQTKSRTKNTKKVTSGGKKKQGGSADASNVEKRKKYVRKKLHGSDSDTPEEECYCLMCLEPFSNSRSREPWVQCIVCKQWAHEERVDSGSMFVCLNCDSGDSDYAH